MIADFSSSHLLNMFLVHPKASTFSFVNRRRKSIGFPTPMVYKGTYIDHHFKISNMFYEKFSVENTRLIDYGKLDNMKYISTDISIPQFSIDDILRRLNQIKRSYIPCPDGIP